MANLDSSVIFAEHPTGPQTKRFRDLTGERLGRLVVLGLYGNKGKVYYWYCRCDCGTVKEIAACSLNQKGSKSCGCLTREAASSRATHGHSRNNTVSTEFSSFLHARSRCNIKSDRCYNRYGGRGIKFMFQSFAEFFAHIGPKPTPNHSLDRIDNLGNYECGNVRWATAIQQAHNTRKCLLVEFNGKVKPLSGWLKNGTKDYFRAYHMIKRRRMNHQEVLSKFTTSQYFSP